MRIKSASSLALIVSALLAGGCTSPSSPERASQTAPDANFAAYRTFGWQPPPAAGSEEPMRLLDSNIREAIRTEMTRRGYTEAKDDPDLWIAYETAADERLKSSPFRIGIGVGSFGSNVGGSVNVGSPSVQSYREGRLVIHVVDAAANRELWFGSIAGSMQKGSLEADAVARAVALAMQDLPARTAAP
ncbi:MAG: DUF4136 domain-containing protein [Gammaproteobacteria bacterium]|nr:DUF4136 domain-containing protein [Gammaproteobacteria bacterium]MCP5139701.1 DUF4136 domain-containing protein [Chromatiales bacterium]